MRKLYPLLLICTLFQFQQELWSQSNEGTEFWFSFMEHRDRSNNRMLMVTSKYNTTGTVTIPGSGWTRNLDIPANGIVTLALPSECENLGSENILWTAVVLRTGQASSAYIHQYNDFRSDAALVLPVTALGKEYFTMSYSAYQNSDDHYPTEFVVVATENQTNIRITTNANTEGGRLKGSSHSIVLDQGQSYQVQGANVSQDLSGSYISSDKPIAVFSGNRWTQVPNGCGNRDNLLEQMYPIETWGKEFVSAPSALTSEDIYRVIASEDQTNVRVENNTGNVLFSYLLNRGEWREFKLFSRASLIKSDKPVNVAHYLVGGLCNGLNGLGDPSMLMLNSTAQFRDTVTLFNTRFQNIYRHFLNIIMRSQDSASLRIDGRELFSFNASFNKMGAQNEFVYATIEVAQGAHTLLAGGCGLIASAYGYGQAESYAYGGGANFYKINSVQSDAGACLGDSILFVSGLPENRFKVRWDLGDGSKSSQHRFKHLYKSLGKYTVRLWVEDICVGTIDSLTKEIEISLRRPLQTSPDTLVCEGSTIVLRAMDVDGAEYQWTGPNDFQSEHAWLEFKNVKAEQAGQYSVVGNYFGCKTYPTSIKIVVVENPIPDLGEDRHFCPYKESLTLTIQSNEAIEWEDGSTFAMRDILRGGQYSIQLTNVYGCSGYDTLLVLEKCPANVIFPNVFSPNSDGINDFFTGIFEYVENPELKIYSRWGEQIFSSNGAVLEWDGNFQGERMMPGVYVYVVQYEGYDEQGNWRKFQASGDLTLIR
ncbi:MAG: gliding motility-associated C-terminal domain-containing protein [Saprospiraceae bacterium]|nr:gliding motility-associated C-terminal domain-containing protein [Saprospiraceae bacterium]MBK9629701.1 gliding motility-associated C-terminal domain-containing protein [Saprospiraceae bacterium]